MTSHRLGTSLDICRCVVTMSPNQKYSFMEHFGFKLDKAGHFFRTTYIYITISCHTQEAGRSLLTHKLVFLPDYEQTTKRPGNPRPGAGCLYQLIWKVLPQHLGRSRDQPPKIGCFSCQTYSLSWRTRTPLFNHRLVTNENLK
jgi:hypothetical protein